MIDLGVDPDQVERDLESKYDEDENAEDVFVYPVNSEAVRVFLACSWQRVAVSSPEGTRLFYQNIAAQEVRTVAEMVGIPRERWEQAFAGVRILEEIALPYLNR